MFKDDYEGFAPFGDSIGSQEISGVGEGLTKECTGEEEWI